jgi:hypothetical protein
VRTRYGKLVGGVMKFSWRMLPGYKAVRFGVIPVFDQGTQFVYQLDLVETETEIFIGVGIGTIAA